jgi:hypothetical protein
LITVAIVTIALPSPLLVIAVLDDWSVTNVLEASSALTVMDCLGYVMTWGWLYARWAELRVCLLG